MKPPSARGCALKRLATVASFAASRFVAKTSYGKVEWHGGRNLHGTTVDGSKMRPQEGARGGEERSSPLT
jgi:hypothetical protein